MEWFFSVGEQQYGPVPESDLLQRIQTGEVGRETLVWNATLQGWIPAGTSDLNPLFPAVAPPPLPVRSATAPPNRTARVVNEVGVLTVPRPIF